MKWVPTGNSGRAECQWFLSFSLNIRSLIIFKTPFGSNHESSNPFWARIPHCQAMSSSWNSDSNRGTVYVLYWFSKQIGWKLIKKMLKLWLLIMICFSVILRNNARNNVKIRWNNVKNSLEKFDLIWKNIILSLID